MILPLFRNNNKQLFKSVFTALLLCQASLAFCVDKKNEIYVKDFGAVGDGKHDDTVAIQKAMDAAFKAIKRRKGPRGSGLAGLRYSSGPAVVFSAGIYKITNTIYVKSRTLLAHGEAVLVQQNKDKDILYFKSSWQTRISGLVFVGGKNQISLGNKNIDKGQLVVANCKFLDANGVGVIVRKGSSSTFFNVRECVFCRCRQAIISNCDWSTIRDCWVTSDQEMKDMAVIVNNKGNMTIDNMLGVPLCKMPGQRWIDNYGNLTCIGCRFGAEGGGFTPVYNFAKYRNNVNGNFVIIRNSTICSQSNYRGRCAVLCIEIPNCIEINNCSMNVPPVKIDRKIKPATYFKGISCKMLNYSANASFGEFNELPTMLKNPPVQKNKKLKTQLNAQETAKKLAEIIKSISHMEKKLKVKSKRFIPKRMQWSLNDYMDATSLKNAEFIAFAKAGDKTVIMRRVDGHNNWAHITVKNIVVDLDKYPVLIFNLDKTNTKGPYQTALKLVDNETESLYTLTRRNSRIKHKYNLKKIGLNGKRNLSLLIYYIPRTYVPPKAAKSNTWKYCKPGDYFTIDELSFQPERK